MSIYLMLHRHRYSVGAHCNWLLGYVPRERGRYKSSCITFSPSLAKSCNIYAARNERFMRINASSRRARCADFSINCYFVQGHCDFKQSFKTLEIIPLLTRNPPTHSTGGHIKSLYFSSLIHSVIP